MFIRRHHSIRPSIRSNRTSKYVMCARPYPVEGINSHNSKNKNWATLVASRNSTARRALALRRAAAKVKAKEGAQAKDGG